MPLLIGLDGREKMSKSLGNYVGITEAPQEMFGKLMSISDELMWRYLELLSFEPLAALRKWRAEVDGGRNPKEVKVLLAKEIVARFHSKAAAQAAEQDFEQRFRHGQLPSELEEKILQSPAGGLGVTQALKLAGFAPSVSEARRLVEQGGVRIDGERLTDAARKFAPGESCVVQVGKRKAAKLRIT
jgi:tyrosyl-tRNA synthetase